MACTPLSEWMQTMMTRDRIEACLASHGYRPVRDTGDHAVYEHRGDRIVIPLHSPELSPWSARAIEWSLEDRLGRGWLTRPLESATTQEATAGHRSVAPLRLHLAVRPEPDRRAWNAFVVDEPRILTFSASLAALRRNAADAADAWFADAAAVDLEFHLQLDAESNRWIDHAQQPTPCPERAAEAQRQLRLIGFADADIDDLLAWTSVRRANGGPTPSGSPFPIDEFPIVC